MMKKNKVCRIWCVCFLLSLFFVRTHWAGGMAGDPPMENQMGGVLKIQGRVTGYGAGSCFDPVGSDPGLDGLAAARLTDKLVLSPRTYVELHYEAIALWGDTREKQVDLAKKRVQVPAGGMSDPSTMDKRRLLDLTTVMEKTDDRVAWHRLDRMLVSVKPAWGDVIVGRQAVTWGNGLVFNPMDLFNPFSPSDTVRDYKRGDDLVSVRVTTGQKGELNLLYVPRRNVKTGDIDFKSASVAGKFHFSPGEREVDLMGGLHYNELVLGVGTSGALGDAAFRCDLVWSSLEPGGDETGSLWFVANLDYSWVWFNKNLYGLIEYYHNGLGKDTYTDALGDPIVLERLDRGEVFVLGKNYISGRVQVELHPLFSVNLGVIANVRDPSCILQPWAVWSLTQNSTLLAGANIYCGGPGSEFGGFLIPGTPYHTNAAANAYVELSYYF